MLGVVVVVVVGWWVWSWVLILHDGEVLRRERWLWRLR